MSNPRPAVKDCTEVEVKVKAAAEGSRKGHRRICIDEIPTMRPDTCTKVKSSGSDSVSAKKETMELRRRAED